MAEHLPRLSDPVDHGHFLQDSVQVFKDLFAGFFEAAVEDARIGPVHMSLYLALLYHWQQQAFRYPVQLFSYQLMPIAKISGTATYHRVIRDLHQFGYIKYLPSHNHVLGSLVYFRELAAVLKSYPQVSCRDEIART